MMINIYKIMSGTKAIIPSLFPGKEPAPNKGNKFRVWHQTEAVEGWSQQRDFGNRELGRHQGWAGKRQEGVLQCQSCWGWNHLLLLSLDFPSWSRRGSKNADLAPAAFPWLEWSETSTTTASSSSGNPSWLSSLPKEIQEELHNWLKPPKEKSLYKPIPAYQEQQGRENPNSWEQESTCRAERGAAPRAAALACTEPLTPQQPQQGHNSKPRARISGFFPSEVPLIAQICPRWICPHKHL